MPAGNPFTSPHYADIISVRLLLGTYNESVAADTNSDGDPINIAMEEDKAMGDADVEINSFLAGEGAAVPAVGTDNYAMVKNAAALLSADLISQFRGVKNERGEPANPYQIYRDRAYVMLNRLVAVINFTPETGPTGPASDKITMYPTWPTNVTWSSPRWPGPYGWW